MVTVASCSGSLGSSVVVLVVIGAVMFVVAALGVSWTRFLQRRLFKGSVDRAIYNPVLVGVAAAVFGVAVFGALFLLGALTEPNSCG